MKTSNKILLALGIVPFIIIFIMLISLRNILDKESVVINQGIDRSNYQTENYDIGPFEEIVVKGIWEIVLTGGDQYRIELEVPPGSLKHTSVTRQGNMLLVKSERRFFSILNFPKIEITVPSISRLDLEGQTDVSISNLKLQQLDINLAGVSLIKGTEGTVKQLSFNGTGIVNADFTHMPTDNARFNFTGIYMITLKMNGGDLAGRLSGQGKMTTEGNIMSNSIVVDNPDFITYK